MGEPVQEKERLFLVGKQDGLGNQRLEAFLLFECVFHLHSLEVLRNLSVLTAHLGKRHADSQTEFSDEFQFFQVLGVLQTEVLNEVVKVLGLGVVASLGGVGLEDALHAGHSQQLQQEGLFILKVLELDVGQEGNDERRLSQGIIVEFLDPLVHLFVADADS